MKYIVVEGGLVAVFNKYDETWLDDFLEWNTAILKIDDDGKVYKLKEDGEWNLILEE